GAVTGIGSFGHTFRRLQQEKSVPLFRGHVPAHHLLEPKEDFFRGHGFFVVECRSHRASSADSSNRTRHPSPRAGRGGRMCVIFFSSVPRGTFQCTIADSVGESHSRDWVSTVPSHIHFASPDSKRQQK